MVTIFELMTHEKTHATQISVAKLSLKVPNAQQISVKVILNIKTAEVNPLYLVLFSTKNANISAARTSYFKANAVPFNVTSETNADYFI
jgi:hypothetical protein